MAHSRTWTAGKILGLVKDLGEPFPHVLGHLQCLWNSAYENCLPAGRIHRDDVEPAAQWDGEEGALLRALIERRLLDTRKRGLYLHDFRKNAPDYVRKRIARQKKQRTKCPDNSGQRPDNGGQRPPTEPNRTQQKKNPPAPRKAGEYSEGFQRFWQAYPTASGRRVKKKQCYRKWVREKLEARTDEIIGILERWKESDQWTKDGGQYIKAVHAWLCDAPWEDGSVPRNTKKEEAERKKQIAEEREAAEKNKLARKIADERRAEQEAKANHAYFKQLSAEEQEFYRAKANEGMAVPLKGDVLDRVAGAIARSLPCTGNGQR